MTRAHPSANYIVKMLCMLYRYGVVKSVETPRKLNLSNEAGTHD